MLRAAVRSAAPLRVLVVQQFVRNIGVTAACSQKAAVDPIQKLFIDKIHDYATKSKSAGGKLVDASPATEKSLTDELEKIARQYGAGAKGVDFTKFPTFAFTDPDLEPVGVPVDAKAVSEHDAQAVAAPGLTEDEDKPYYEV